jgi:hypothetical protein
MDGNNSSRAFDNDGPNLPTQNHWSLPSLSTCERRRIAVHCCCWFSCFDTQETQHSARKFIGKPLPFCCNDACNTYTDIYIFISLHTFYHLVVKGKLWNNACVSRTRCSYTPQWCKSTGRRNDSGNTSAAASP